MNDDHWDRASHALRWVAIVVMILALVLVALSAFFFVARQMSGVYRPFYYPFFFPFGLFFWIFIIFSVLWALRLVFSPWGYRRRNWRYRDESYHILRERYAKGEITKEQFEQMMQDLERHR
jgi:putative membrane protein